MNRAILVAASMLVVAACGQEVASTSTFSDIDESTGTSVQASSTTRPTGSADDIDDLIQAAIGARSVLAEDLDVAEDTLKLISSEAVTWRDGSVGCPEPGQVYTQAEVVGFLVVFEHNGERFEVHQAKQREPVVCLKPADDGFIPPTKKAPEISIPPPID